ncbi:hypothetical protein [Nostoc sp.]
MPKVNTSLRSLFKRTRVAITYGGRVRHRTRGKGESDRITQHYLQFCQKK